MRMAVMTSADDVRMGVTTFICADCGRTLAWLRARQVDLPDGGVECWDQLVAADGTNVTMTHGQAPRLRCRCGKVTILLEGSLR